MKKAAYRNPRPGIDCGKTGTIRLNDLEIRLDAETGCLRELSYPGVGTLLSAGSEDAGILDCACPISAFEPLRLAPRFTKGASIATAEGGVTISWENLAPSRKQFAIDGTIPACVTLKALPDGRSVSLSCEIVNHSAHSIRQILFPDFCGFLPFGGDEQTILMTGAGAKRPFIDIETADKGKFYCRQYEYPVKSSNINEMTLKSGGMANWQPHYDPMIMRWYDIGCYAGGMSVFPRTWGWDAQETVWLKVYQRTRALRIANIHYLDLKREGVWRSPEYVLTPHRSGWAKGIEVYRDWVRQHITRKHPFPKHIRNGLGFRSLWMAQQYPEDEQDVMWTFSDLPELAAEAKEHGLVEMVPWMVLPGFELPMPPPFPSLGSEKDFSDAVAECKKIGVNVAAFISVLQAVKKTAHKYGLTVPDNAEGWTYHTDFIPRFRPSYAHRYKCVGIDIKNTLWQQEVVESCERLARNGIASICYDQFISCPSLYELTARIREIQKQHDPHSTFSGEQLVNIELDSGYLDYTWNWEINDYRALVSVFPFPRPNYNIGADSELEAKIGFADNSFLNVFLAKPDQANGSAFIRESPQLSKALMQCAKLRAQFLRYFTEGVFISDCILAEACSDSHIAAYVLPDSLFVIVINTGKKRTMQCHLDVSAWLKSASPRHEITTYNGDGKAINDSHLNEGKPRITLPELEPMGIIMLEVRN